MNGNEVSYQIPANYSEFDYSAWVAFFKTQGDFLIKLLAAGGFDLNFYLETRNKFDLKPSQIDFIQLNQFKESFIDENGELKDIEISVNPLPIFTNILVNFYNISLFTEKLYATNINAITFEQFVVCEEFVYQISIFDKQKNNQALENCLKEIFKTLYLPENQQFQYGQVRKINVTYPDLMICYYHYLTNIKKMMSLYADLSRQSSGEQTSPSAYWWDFKINYFNLTQILPEQIDKMNLEDILRHIQILKDAESNA